MLEFNDALCSVNKMCSLSSLYTRHYVYFVYFYGEPGPMAVFSAVYVFS